MSRRWFEILEYARELETKFTSHDLAEEAEIGVNEASAWIDKFFRWRYVTHEGRVPPTGPGRPTLIYKLTHYGKTVTPEDHSG